MPSRNVNERFALNPVNIDIQRSKFNMPHEVKTSFNVGQLIPFDVQEVLPGDTFRVRTSKVVRMQPLVSAPMDNLFLDTYYFFVPNRLVWKHWKEFMGENTESAWIPQTEYSVPMIQFDGGASPGSIADYMGIPIDVNGSLNVNALPFRAYALICNEWFRNENLVPPLNLEDGDTGQIGSKSTDSDYNNNTISVVNGGAPFKVSKLRDYFVSCLPGPQKGPDVSVLGGTSSVYFEDVELPSASTINDKFDKYGANKSNMAYLRGADSSPHSTFQTEVNESLANLESSTYGATGFQPMNWMVDYPSLSINALRLAFQVQKLYEKEARAGSRYVEILKGHFGVNAPDASLQRPQYLGGAVRIPIQINQVLQTSESGTTPQGNVAGYSLTSDINYDFEHSFTEHGFIIGVMCARYQHTYQQGLNKMWTRKNKLNYYFPVLANIGEEPVLRGEIYARGVQQDGSEPDEEVFGYNEAWASYRYRPNIVTGEMRSNISNSLDSWHFADDYDSAPYLSESWICEDKSNVDRVLAVQSSVSNQLFADILVDTEAVRPMPLYSIPGLIDHH